jgi:vancomycin permeability regulator SanA
MSLLHFVRALVADLIPRGIALFFGVFGLLNLVGELVSPGFDANLWWIDLPAFSNTSERALLGWAALCFLGFARSCELSARNKIVLTATIAVLLEASIWNAATVSNLIASQAIQSRSFVSFSGCVTGALLLIICGIWSTCAPARPSQDRSTAPSPIGPSDPLSPQSTTVRITVILFTAACCAVVFPLAQMYCFGSTDYRRQADVIVILGSRVYADGAVSLALDQRLQTGAELYHQGLASHLLMSGGPGDGEIHETDAMRDRAIQLGVPVAAIFLDREGLDTQATAVNTVRRCRECGWHRVLAVSHFYHLPRIKLAFHRHGMEVYTVPAVETRALPKLPYYLLREIAALWMYYFWF